MIDDEQLVFDDDELLQSSVEQFDGGFVVCPIVNIRLSKYLISVSIPTVDNGYRTD